MRHVRGFVGLYFFFVIHGRHPPGDRLGRDRQARIARQAPNASMDVRTSARQLIDPGTEFGAVSEGDG